MAVQLIPESAVCLLMVSLSEVLHWFSSDSVVSLQTSAKTFPVTLRQDVSYLIKKRAWAHLLLPRSTI